MYQLDKTTHHSHKIAAGLLFFIICGVIFGLFWLYRYLQTDNTLSQSLPKTTHVTIAATKVKLVKGAGFTMKVPESWQSIDNTPVPNKYSWQGVGKVESPRRIDVYVNDIPAMMSINRLLPVKDDGNGIVVAGNVSENCVNFTDKKNTQQPSGDAPAKWAGIDFLCDMTNYVRNVTGIGSSDGINRVSVTGDSGTKYNFFVVYTDHSAESDYTIFTDILKSFQAM